MPRILHPVRRERPQNSAVLNTHTKEHRYELRPNACRRLDSRHQWQTRYLTASRLYQALTNPDQSVISEDDEILLVMLGDIVLYSQLSSDRGLTVDDLTGFFA